MNVILTNQMKKILHGEKAVAIASASMNKSVFDTDVGVSDSELLNNVVSTVNEVFENDKKISGSVLLTDSRIILYSKRTLGGYYFKDFRINSINGVTFKNGFLKSSMIFHTNNGATKINMPDKNAAKKLNIALETRISKWKKEAIAIGTYDSVELTSHIPTKHSDNINSDLLISRETEFYQGFIRLKMSVTNTSSFVVNDVTLDFDYDDNLLRIDRHEPSYQIENGKVIFGNISVDSSKTVAIYFDPMMCSKGTYINCPIHYKDAKGHLQTTQMESKKISVVCPIMETESDINIGRLKEFIEKLSYRDSKVYQVQNVFDINILKNISREIVQKHNVKHIRTLFTKDKKMCEIWYYGKTKVHSHDIVIKITILSETQNIELFAATQTVESLAGLLAEVGRELKSAIESKVTGNVQQVINVSIKDSIVQRSNLLNYCDIDGNCSGDVVIEDSLVIRSNIGLDAEVKDIVVQKTDVDNKFCTVCGEAVPDGAKFCMECGERLK